MKIFIAVAIAALSAEAAAPHNSTDSKAAPALEAAADTCAQQWPSTSSSVCATAVAVCLAESGGNCGAKYVNAGGSIDRGLWQINDYWHKEVTDSCAYNCACNGKEAYRISSSGTSWTPWATYNSGAYKSHLSAAQAACAKRLASNSTQL